MIVEEKFPVTRHEYNRHVYEVNDVSVHKNDGKTVKGWVAYSIDGGPLLSSCFEYEYVSPSLCTLNFIDNVTLAEIGSLVNEVRGEVAEAAAYQRDELKGKN